MCLAYLPGPGAWADVVLGKGYLAQRGLSHRELTLCSLPSQLRSLESYVSSKSCPGASEGIVPDPDLVIETLGTRLGQGLGLCHLLGTSSQEPDLSLVSASKGSIALPSLRFLLSPQTVLSLAEASG